MAAVKVRGIYPSQKYPENIQNLRPMEKIILRLKIITIRISGLFGHTHHGPLPAALRLWQFVHKKADMFANGPQCTTKRHWFYTHFGAFFIEWDWHSPLKSMKKILNRFRKAAPTPPPAIKPLEDILSGFTKAIDDLHALRAHRLDAIKANDATIGLLREENNRHFAEHSKAFEVAKKLSALIS